MPPPCSKNILSTPHLHITIYSHSLGSLQCLQNMYTSYTINVEIKEKIHNLHRLGKHITLWWVPGHNDRGQSTTTDSQARLVTQDLYMNTHPIHELFYKDATRYTSKLILDKWHLDWTKQKVNYGRLDLQ